MPSVDVVWMPFHDTLARVEYGFCYCFKEDDDREENVRDCTENGKRRTVEMLQAWMWKHLVDLDGRMVTCR